LRACMAQVRISLRRLAHVLIHQTMSTSHSPRRRVRRRRDLPSPGHRHPSRGPSEESAALNEASFRRRITATVCCNGIALTDSGSSRDVLFSEMNESRSRRMFANNSRCRRKSSDNVTRVTETLLECAPGFEWRFEPHHETQSFSRQNVSGS
jgi:hypothetical protein